MRKRMTSLCVPLQPWSASEGFKEWLDTLPAPEKPKLTRPVNAGPRLDFEKLKKNVAKVAEEAKTLKGKKTKPPKKKAARKQHTLSVARSAVRDI